MKPLEPIAQEILQCEINRQVSTLSPLEREAYLDRYATQLLIDDDKAMDALACKYIHQEVFHQAHKRNYN